MCCAHATKTGRANRPLAACSILCVCGASPVAHVVYVCVCVCIHMQYPCDRKNRAETSPGTQHDPVVALGSFQLKTLFVSSATHTHTHAYTETAQCRQSSHIIPVVPPLFYLSLSTYILNVTCV